MKIAMPECNWCGTKERVFMCKVCDRFTCRECVLYPEEDRCVHAKKEPVKSIGWYKDSETATPD